MVVDKNGTGNYTSVGEAIDAVPDNSSERTLIFIKNGEYYEKVIVPSSKINVSLVGESVEGVIISYDDNPSKVPAADTYTFYAGADDLYAENVTFQNTSGNVGQALAIRTTGDRMVFKNCRMLGFQDTYYAHKRRQYNLKCYVEGATDFIYGDATTVFDSCTINCLNGGSYITAPADTKLITNFSTGPFLHGLLFRYSNITADENVAANSYYLGRPWQPNASSVFLNCTLGNHIKPEGWSTWGGNNHESSYFAEYKSKNPDGTLVDTTARVEWSYQVSEFAANNFYKLSFFLRKDFVEWDPLPVTRELPKPQNIHVQGEAVSWDPVENAIGYVISKNSSVIGFSMQNSFSGPSVSGGEGEITVKSVTANGALSMGVSSIVVSGPVIREETEIGMVIANGKISFSEKVSFGIYSLAGNLIYQGNGSEVNVSGFIKGMYIVKIINNIGIKKTQIIVI